MIIPGRRPDTLLFSLTLLVSAFLLFAVQPMIGKMLLPWLGGTPAVWNTCMLFFQACLLGGYAYAHVLAVRWRFRTQAIVHATLLVAALFTLPIRLIYAGDPPVQRDPTRWLLAALLTSAGPAFLVVSGTAPLLQRWFATTLRDPYFLYAASNAGSLIALLAYPLVIGPHLRLAAQAWLWQVGYIALTLLIALCAIRTARAGGADARLVPADETVPTPRPTPMRGERLRWVVLAFVPSSYLLGVTAFLCSDIAAVPLLWVAPLALYLLTFVLAFAGSRTAPRALPPAIVAVAVMIMARASQPMWLVLGVHLLAFFVAALACHGRLARLRPPPARLTDFYLMLALGGALGGAFNAIVAPLVFDRTLEYPLAIALACLVAMPRRDEDAAVPQAARRARATSAAHLALDVALPLAVGALAVAAVALVPARTGRGELPVVLALLAIPALVCWTFRARPARFAFGVVLLLLPPALLPPAGARVLEVRRSFFGVHRVLRTADGQYNQLFHGTTLHGAQRVDPATGAPVAPERPTSYYYADGPHAQVLEMLGSAHPRPRVGVVGLGAGAIAGFAHAGWDVTFFEIDPALLWAAERSGHFSYLEAARRRGARVTTTLGDARLALARVPDERFDLLIIDAFSGDAIPVHLLTREALGMYLAKLRRDEGLLLIHISNLYLDLRPVVAALAADAGCAALIRDDRPPKEARDAGAESSRVVVLAHRASPLAPLAADERWKPLGPATGGSALTQAPTQRKPWTDDFANLVEIMRWNQSPE